MNADVLAFNFDDKLIYSKLTSNDTKFVPQNTILCCVRYLTYVFVNCKTMTCGVTLITYLNEITIIRYQIYNSISKL